MSTTANSTTVAKGQATNILFKQAVELQSAGRHLEASMRYEYLLQMQPNDWRARYNYGFALQALGRFDDAIRAYETVTRIQPTLAEAYVNLGNTHLELKQHTAALSCYEKAATLKPELAIAHYNQSIALRNLSRFSESIAPLRRTVQLELTHNAAWEALCSILFALKRVDESVQAFLEWEQHIPASPELAIAGLRMSRYLGGEARESKYLKMVFDWPFPPPTPTQLSAILVMVQYFDITFDQQLVFYRRYQAAASATVLSQSLHFPRRLRGEKIRIGYISADFRNHVMGRLMREIITRHDRAQFEIHLFALHQPVHDDDRTREFISMVDLYVNVSALSIEKAAQTIAERDLDILIDLAGHTWASRPEVYCYKPARVIATHMAYHGCIGLSEVDYKVTDRYADRIENRAYQIEELLPIEGCLFPFSHVDPADDIGISREDLGLGGKFVFATFVNLLKLSTRCLKVWKIILERVSHAVLAFSPVNPAEKTSVQRVLAEAGIDAARLIFLPATTDDTQMRARYRLTDAVLDTFPYCGGDTTLAALDMDMPVVTLVGERHSERIGLSILSNLGVTDTIAATEAEYVERAIRLASDARWYRTVREKIVAAKASSAFCDTGQYVKNLEAAYRRILNEKKIVLASVCSLSPREFSVKFQEALAAHQKGEHARAQQLYLELSNEQPDYPVLNYFHGTLMRECGEQTQAITLLSRAAAHAPTHVEARIALGNLYLDLQQNDAAIATFQQVIDLQPHHPEALGGLGLALLQDHRAAEAVEPLAKAQESKPADTRIAFNFAVALHRAGALREATEAYSRTLSLSPNDAEAAYNFAILMAGQGQWLPAEELFRRVLAHAPAHAAAYCRLRDVLAASGKIDALLLNQQMFEKYCPADPRQMLGQLDRYRYAGDFVHEAKVLQEVIHVAVSLGDDVLAEALLERLLDILPFYDIAPDDERNLALRYNRAGEKHYSQVVANLARARKPDTTNNGRIRIGYLSADFLDTAAGRTLHAMLAQHDTGKIELYCYTLSSQQDEVTRACAALSKRMALVSDLDAIDAARLIANDSLDILVDVSSAGHCSALSILACKPARIVVSHPFSMRALDLDAIDYRLTDNKIALSHNQQFPVEKLFTMAGCAYPFRRISSPQTPLLKRVDLNMAENAIVLAAFVPLQYLSLRCLLLWRQILQQLPEAVLLFAPLHSAEQPYYVRVLSAVNIDRERLRFAPPPKNDSEVIGLYRLADLVLDPFPCGNPLGSVAAVNAGTPVVTLIGQRDGERIVQAILHHLGLSETVANSGLEYVDIAIKLARDMDFKAAVKAKVQQGLAASIELDATVKNLEAAYGQMVHLATEQKQLSP